MMDWGEVYVISGRTHPGRKRDIHEATADRIPLSIWTTLFEVDWKMPEKKHFERLPGTVIPRHYDLHLQPNLTAFTFTGKEVINAQVSDQLKYLTARGQNVCKAFKRHKNVCNVFGFVSP